MAEAQPITKTYDPLPRITAYNESRIPSTPPKEQKKGDKDQDKDKSNPLDSPIVAELVYIVLYDLYNINPKTKT